MIETLIYLLVVLLVAAVFYWAVTRILSVLPVPEPFRTIILVVFVVIVLLIVLNLFMPFATLGGPHRLGW